MTIDPLLTEAAQAEIVSDVLDMLIPWMLGERGEMFVVVTDRANRPGIELKVAELGGRVAVRHRERLLVKGARRDKVFYQFFSSWWRQVLGDPPDVPLRSESVQSNWDPPAAVHATLEDRIPDACAVGERLYLRPFRIEEGEKVASWALDETERFYAEGRAVVSGYAYGAQHKAMAELEPPNVLRFAIVLKESDEFIGCVGFEGIDWLNRSAVTETELFQSEARSRGYGSEAKALLLDYAFDSLGLHMVFSFVVTTNPRSAAALVKQGYRRAGLIAWDSLTAGGLAGFWSFDLLASEWHALRGFSEAGVETEP